MSLSRVKVWIAGEVLTASDLNSEFNNILNNAPSLFSPFGGNLTFSPDATYDIGASGLTRPRNIYLSGTVVANGSALTGGYRSSGLVGVNNSGTPNTKYDFVADLVQLIDSSGNTVRRTNTGTVTNDTGLTGPALNGRDASSAFSNSTWVHFYWIWNGVTLGTVSSATAPPTGPALPTGYTHWGYIGAIYKNSSGNLQPTKIRGRKVYYNTTLTALSAGAATSWTSISLAAFVPPNALDVDINGEAAATLGGGQYNFGIEIGISGTSVVLDMGHGGNDGAGTGYHWGGMLTIPNVSQTMYYEMFTGGACSGSNGYVLVAGYSIPNGGE